MKILKELEQRSEEWFKARRGVVTASDFEKILTPTGKRSTQLGGVIDKKVAEILTGNIEESYSNAAMQRGIDLEGEAFEFAKTLTDIEFTTVGFVDSENGYGCSPDGLCEEKKIGLEIKCPMPHTHINYLRANKLPGKYFPQVQGSMLVTGYSEWYFCSYHPEVKSLLIKVERDHAYCEQLLAQLVMVADQIKREVEKFSI